MSKKYKKAVERESIVQDESYIHVLGWQVNKLNLKGNALMIYAIIHGFTNHKDKSIDKFKGSLRYLADWTNSSKQGVLNALEKLMELKYIEKNPIEVNGVNYVEYRSRMLYDDVKEVAYRTQRTWIETVKYVDSDIQNSGHNNIDNTPEVTKGVIPEGSKGSEDVSPKTEDTPPTSEIEEMKKQLQELQMQLKEQIEEKKQKQSQEQGQNREENDLTPNGSHFDKTKTPLVKEKDDKVKGEKDEDQTDLPKDVKNEIDRIISEAQKQKRSEQDEFFDKYGFSKANDEEDLVDIF